MSYHSDPTANAAIGAVDREIERMIRRAERIKRRRQNGKLTPEELAAARRQFTGIYSRLLRAALTDSPDPPKR